MLFFYRWGLTRQASLQVRERLMYFPKEFDNSRLFFRIASCLEWNRGKFREGRSPPSTRTLSRPSSISPSPPSPPPSPLTGTLSDKMILPPLENSLLNDFVLNVEKPNKQGRYLEKYGVCSQWFRPVPFQSQKTPKNRNNLKIWWISSVGQTRVVSR